MEKSSKKAWLKQLGIAGFLFFLAKGLIWLGVFAAFLLGFVDNPCN